MPAQVGNRREDIGAAINVWGVEISEAALSLRQIEYLETLPQKRPENPWVWEELDRVWDEFDLNNRLPLSAQPINEFYTHPVWLMNGIFSAVDPVSLGHREAIAAWLSQHGTVRIADYGGGFGELALQIVRAVRNASVSIVEPYASSAASERIHEEPRISIVPDFDVDQYDAIIAQDVLEHVEDPISLAWRIASAVRHGGYAVFANCFYPLIKCHLPSGFHLRYTFRWVMTAMGLRYVGRVSGAQHAGVFERIGPVDLRRARRAERLSQFIGPVLNGIFKLRALFKGMLFAR
jgi:2-polyprenyl-6-hydroxyphenyl methylase/3-demethylubiquinone-9 3-methyltransferase